MGYIPCSIRNIERSNKKEIMKRYLKTKESVI